MTLRRLMAKGASGRLAEAAIRRELRAMGFSDAAIRDDIERARASGGDVVILVGAPERCGRPEVV